MVVRTGILPKSPLIFTLASVRFAPWGLIGQKIDEIHNELRDILPLMQRFQVQTVVQGAGSPQPEVTIWMLMSGDRKRAVQLSQDQILITSSRYTRYDEFSKLIDRLLSALLVRMCFMDITNIGVRFIDHVVARNEDNLEQYLCPGLLPPKFKGLDGSGGALQASYLRGSKELRVRCIAQPGASSYPEEILPLLAMMQPPGRTLQVKPLKINECLFDIDSLEQYEEPIRIEQGEKVVERMYELHVNANEFFRREEVFTDHAFKVWKGEV